MTMRAFFAAGLTALTVTFGVFGVVLSGLSGAQAEQLDKTDAAAAERVEIATGGWTNQEYKIEGEWTIYFENGKNYISLSDNFRTRRGPDLKLFLSPMAPEDLTGRNATRGSVLVSALESSRGAQTFEIPEGTDLSQFASVVIHCERFSKLWGAGPLAVEG